MIRFSAGLVVVAFGVLIGGVATSKLSLVYVSIAVSVLALAAWAIGVFLKRRELREELFGGRTELELVPAGAGVSAGSPAPGRPTSAPQSPAASSGPAVPPGPAVPSAGWDRPGYGQDGFNAVAFSSATQVRPTWTPKRPAPKAPGPQSAPDRAAAPLGGWGSTSTPPSGTPPVASRATDGAQKPQAPPGPQAPPPPTVAAGPGTTKSADAGSGGALRSWFDRPGPVWDKGTHTDNPTLGDVGAPAVEDDDWPTRYSWLDDEEAEGAVESDGTPRKPDDPQQAEAAQTIAPPAARSALVDAAHDADEAPVSPPEEAKPPAEQGGGPRLVTVVPGVPRYHEPDCILIRFMPSGDVATKSISEAKAANCTPCAACQPAD